MTHPMLTWLEAQLDDDEKLAHDASHRDATWHLETVPVRWGEDYVPDILAGGKPILRGSSEYTGLASAHAVRHDPAAVLADIAAKRLMLDDIFDYEAKIDGEWGCCHSAEDIRNGHCTGTPVGEIRGVRILASGFATRPGYLPEWAPT